MIVTGRSVHRSLWRGSCRAGIAIHQRWIDSHRRKVRHSRRRVGRAKRSLIHASECRRKTVSDGSQNRAKGCGGELTARSRIMNLKPWRASPGSISRLRAAWVVHEDGPSPARRRRPRPRLHRLGSRPTPTGEWAILALARREKPRASHEQTASGEPGNALPAFTHAQKTATMSQGHPSARLPERRTTCYCLPRSGHGRGAGRARCPAWRPGQPALRDSAAHRGRGNSQP